MAPWRIAPGHARRELVTGRQIKEIGTIATVEGKGNSMFVPPPILGRSTTRPILTRIPSQETLPPLRRISKRFLTDLGVKVGTFEGLPVGNRGFRNTSTPPHRSVN